MREFTVAGGIVSRAASSTEPTLQEVLLVCNQRRDGRRDWTPPGGIVDDGESVLEGLTREVREETQLVVSEWGSQIYDVSVEFVGRDFGLRALVFPALEWHGALHVDDPDGVVVDAAFVSGPERESCLDLAPRWVAEPVRDWLSGPWTGSKSFSYRATGSHDAMRVERISSE